MAQIITALGLMSGTSLDGIDAAICVGDGHRIIGFGACYYRPYSSHERAILRAALGKWHGDRQLGQARALVHHAHLEVIEQFPQAELIGFHGQSLAHAPMAGRTHQLGDGAALARACGKPVVWDFRSADIEAGGQGAPLAPFFHFALMQKLGLRERIAVLNLGGVGNLSLIAPCQRQPQDAGALYAFDTGPANAPLDDLMRRRGAGAFDKGGQIAMQGRADGNIVARLLDDPYFTMPAPKSLDRNHFADWQDAVADLSLPDALATLAEGVVGSVCAAQSCLAARPERWLICGGGRHNQFIMNRLQNTLNVPVAPIEALGFDGDMLEAQAFAHLAIRVRAGLPTSAKGTTGCRQPLCGGVISGP